MKQKFNATVWREGDWFVAQCLEVDVASQGKTEQEALQNLREALELHFEEPQATITPHVTTVEAEISAKPYALSGGQAQAGESRLCESQPKG